MNSTSTAAPRSNPGKRQSLNVHAQLHALNLSPFEGRQHCGIDVSWPIRHARDPVQNLVELTGHVLIWSLCCLPMNQCRFFDPIVILARVLFANHLDAWSDTVALREF